MKFLIIFIFSLFIISKIWDYLFHDYMKTDYPIRYFIGLRRKGKTTLATKLAIHDIKDGKQVYSNFELFGANKFKPEDFGNFGVPPESSIYLDEVSLIWSNRNFKSFEHRVEEFFRLSGHHQVNIFLFSQSFDVDKKIRDIVDDIYIIDKYFGVFSIAKKVRRDIKLHKASKDEDTGAQQGENFITEDFKFAFPTQWIFTFIPRWVKFFNSFEAPKLPRIKDKRYIFNNEPYLYKLTNSKFFYKESIKERVKAIKDKHIINKYAFKINLNKYMNIINHYDGFIMCH